ncbi:MAG TPA: hypothetical protein VEF35_02205 [Candidatus Bathyarchaeia archaeon]|nr:hypothetical protein [Candidatus Bathyarchaeia archaeon]
MCNPRPPEQVETGDFRSGDTYKPIYFCRVNVVLLKCRVTLRVGETHTSLMRFDRIIQSDGLEEPAIGHNDIFDVCDSETPRVRA